MLQSHLAFLGLLTHSDVHIPSSAIGHKRALCNACMSSLAISSLDQIADKYDAFLLDQFGVIHDGKVAYEGAVEAVTRLQRMGKKIIILSNSSRRKADTIQRLEQMGFKCEHGPHPMSVVTSGELVWENLHALADGFHDLGEKCTVFGNGVDDLEYVTSCEKVPSAINDADFILARGLFSILSGDEPVCYSQQMEAKMIETALSKCPGGIPMLVANPDLTRPDGLDSPMPGQLAQRYIDAGAEDVRFVGKPHPLVYDACSQILSSCGLPAGCKVAAVGDSLEHDILGATRAGVDSVFICSGVHYKELGVAQPSMEAPRLELVQDLFEGYARSSGEGSPTHVLPAFRFLHSDI